MSDKYIFDAAEKSDLIDSFRIKLRHVKAYPQDYRKGYAEKLEKLIAAYESHPDAQIVVTKVASLDDLNLDDTPNETPTSPDAEKFLVHVERLIDQDHVQYARDYLESVMESVRNSGGVSDKQWQAVQNIDDGGKRRQGGYGRTFF